MTSPLVDLRRLPTHVAIIMDGNGRWAQGRGAARPVGHREGSSTVRMITRACRRLGVRGLTLYAFSAQNWQRPQFEVDALMELLREFLLSERTELLDNGIRLDAVGRLDLLPARVRDVLDPLMAETAHLEAMTLTLALSYGGQEEIVDVARTLAARVARGELTLEGITEEAFGAAVPSLRVGPVDLMIRTGGEQRISNFLLWGAAYAELVFTDCLWPEFTEVELYAAIAEFQQRDRRFGKVSAEPDARAVDAAEARSRDPQHVTAIA